MSESEQEKPADVQAAEQQEQPSDADLTSQRADLEEHRDALSPDPNTVPDPDAAPRGQGSEPRDAGRDV